MIWEMTRETEGLLTVVGERESWEENIDNEPIKFSLCYYVTWREATAATRSVVSSASGEWQELRLLLGVLFGLGKDDSFKWWFSGDPQPNPRDVWKLDECLDWKSA